MLEDPDYDRLLAWLSNDPAQSELEYRRIRAELIRVLGSRGCPVPEELADETIERVARKVPQIADKYEGNPARYFHGVARNVFREYLKRPAPSPMTVEHVVDPARESDDDDRSFECLDGCLEQLNEPERALIRDYYTLDLSAKIERRRRLAETLGLAPHTLRMRAYRIRRRLFECVTACLEAVGSA